MKTIRFIHWQEGNAWLGDLEDYPDYKTQGTELGDLEGHLLDLYKDLTGGHIPNVRRIGELQIV
ncbi:type II toxin-antitoxin system HicB family antitoxin [Candidatus Sumerlaeota bacterium]|nr:type II toxin-antitoxin system HicB family antitoxin [Candidatus Sumerlaeota bacterium]